ncbi:MAG: DUF2061 domain-containing protein [Nanoarchaeota archaeon]|nr:DUF2061 domain-containing protein [Nanoarchaeota archaeon]
MDSQKRTIVKTLTWRVVATVVVIFVTYYYTDSWGIALTAGFASAVIKTVLYYIHERLWNKSNYGRELKKVR